jgi:hypothetical protein
MFSEDDEWRFLGSLTYLNATSTTTSVNERNLSYLSPNMTTLEIRTQSSFPSLLLPRNLRKLRIMGPYIFRDDFLANLPAAITDLELNWLGEATPQSDNFQLYDSGISLLPRKLQNLKIIPTDTLTDKAMRHLPPHLRSLALLSHSTRVLKFTNACAALLPRRLCHLILSPCPKITDGAMKHFPRTLAELLILRDDPWTEECRPDLPPRLKHLLDPPNRQRRIAHAYTEAEEFLINSEETGSLDQYS